MSYRTGSFKKLGLPEKLYVVAYQSDDDPLDTVWTVSDDPEACGWETDGGCEGYGLTKEVALEIVRRYNASK
jgi:hypothetical protein